MTRLVVFIASIALQGCLLGPPENAHPTGSSNSDDEGVESTAGLDEQRNGVTDPGFAEPAIESVPARAGVSPTPLIPARTQPAGDDTSSDDEPELTDGAPVWNPGVTLGVAPVAHGTPQPHDPGEVGHGTPQPHDGSDESEDP